jgi:hypothetical protein
VSRQPYFWTPTNPRPVTSIFGMTNMPAEPEPFWPFAIVLVAICIPFFSIIGFLSTKYGYSIWAQKTKELWRWLQPNKASQVSNDTDLEAPIGVNHTKSTEEGMRLRLKDGEEAPRRRPGHKPVGSYPHIQCMVERTGEGRESGLSRMGTVMDEDELDREKAKSGRTGGDTIINIHDP